MYFQLITHVHIKITKKYYLKSHYEFAAKQQKNPTIFL